MSRHITNQVGFCPALYCVMSETNGHRHDFRALNTKLTRRPGQRGTKPLLAQYSDRLVCIRSRDDV